MPDAWSQADPYEAYVGRWSRLLAPAFVAWAGVAPGARVLDVGCGTGALSEALLAAGASGVVGIDLSSAYANEARRRLGARGARFEVADAQEIPFPDGAFDAALSALVLNFAADPARMAREMARVVRPGGAVAVYVWDYAGRMELIRRFWDAAIALDPRAAPLDEGARFPLCEPGALRALFEKVGLQGVEARGIEVPTVFRDFDDYWAPFLGGQGPAPGYLASLDDKAREALREHLRASLPRAPDGRIALTARAWGVRGRR